MKGEKGVGLEHLVYVEPTGTSDRLALWRARDVTVQIMFKDKNFIDFKVGGSILGK